jgi:hypothetical protein
MAAIVDWKTVPKLEKFFDSERTPLNRLEKLRNYLAANPQNGSPFFKANFSSVYQVLLECLTQLETDLKDSTTLSTLTHFFHEKLTVFIWLICRKVCSHYSECVGSSEVPDDDDGGNSRAAVEKVANEESVQFGRSASALR